MTRTLIFLTALLLGAGTALADLESGMVRFEQGDFEGALAELQPAAKAGEPQAQYIVGVMHLNGMVGAPDAAAAAGWIRQAAEQGHIEAQVELARMYHTGEGVARDEAEMVRWYQAAAEQGHVGAQLFVADAYAYGYGVEPDRVQAYMWYEIAMRYWGDLALPARQAVAEHMSQSEIAEAVNRAALLAVPPAPQ